MIAARLALLAGKQAVGELLAVVGQQLGDPDRTGLVQRPQKGLRTGGGRAGLELYEHPSRSLVDGHEQVAPVALIPHLGRLPLRAELLRWAKEYRAHPLHISLTRKFLSLLNTCCRH